MAYTVKFRLSDAEMDDLKDIARFRLDERGAS
jgi:hypothetical protein